MLLDLHSTLLSATALNSTQQTALSIAAHRMIKQSQISSVVQLLWLAGSTAQMTSAVQEQIAVHLQEGLLLHLADKLSAVQHCNSAAHALLQCITKLTELATQQQLELLLLNKAYQTQIVAAACTSSATASATAKLLLLLASRGQHAAALLQPLVPANRGHTTSEEMLTACSWITTAMLPLLQQVHNKLNTWPQVEAAGANAESWPGLTVPQQQVGLLLCNIVAAVHQATALGMSPTMLHMFFKTPVAASAIQAVLLCSSSPRVQRAATQMVNQLAALSTHLACCCFQAVAPVMGQLLSQPLSPDTCSGSCSDDSFNVQAAAEFMWKELLKRMTDKTILAAAVANSLPHAAAAVARMATGAASSVVATTAIYNNSAVVARMDRCFLEATSYSSSTSTMPDLSVFTSLSISYSCYDKPLLPDQPQHTVAVLMPHLPSFVQFLAAAPALHQQAMNGLQTQALTSPLQIQQLESVMLLSFWMLQSLVDALHKVERKAITEDADCVLTEAALTEVVRAAAAVIAPHIVGGARPASSVQLYLPLAAIQLVRSFLKASQCSSDWQVSDMTWHDVAASLADFLASAEQSLGASVQKRQLLRGASQLAKDLALHKPHVLLLPFASKTVDISSSGSSSNRVAGSSPPLPTAIFNRLSSSCTAAAPCEPVRSVAELLQTHLRTVLAELQQRKLERSSSGQELLAAVEAALHVFEQLGACS